MLLSSPTTFHVICLTFRVACANAETSTANKNAPSRAIDTLIKRNSPYPAGARIAHRLGLGRSNVGQTINGSARTMPRGVLDSVSGA